MNHDPRLIALYSIFNEAELLPESIASIIEFVDEVRIYDGRYTEFRCPCGRDHDSSCDGTQGALMRAGFPPAGGEVARSKMQYRELPAMGEMQKRTRMFQELREGDVSLVIDGDELFYGNGRALRAFAALQPAKVGWVRSLTIRHAKDWMARLFVKTPGLRYESYYHLVDDQGPVCDMHAAYERRWEGCYQLPNARLVLLYGEGVALGYRPLERDRARVQYNELLRERGWR